MKDNSATTEEHRGAASEVTTRGESRPLGVESEQGPRIAPWRGGIGGRATSAEARDALPLVHGMEYWPDFLTIEQEEDLLNQFATFSWEPIRFRGQLARRSAVYFGYGYVTTGRSLVPAPTSTGPSADLWRRCEEVAGACLHQVIVAHYPVGAGIGWHVDAEVFGEPILGVTLKAACAMKFRRAGGPILTMPVAPRSLYVMRGEARWDWQHHIPPVREERYSITFRTVRDRGSIR